MDHSEFDAALEEIAMESLLMDLAMSMRLVTTPSNPLTEDYNEAGMMKEHRSLLYRRPTCCNS
jgi:hypothetical protein